MATRTVAEMKRDLDEIMVSIREAVASTAKPTRSGLLYLVGLRARASELGQEIDAAVRNTTTSR